MKFKCIPFIVYRATKFPPFEFVCKYLSKKVYLVFLLFSLVPVEVRYFLFKGRGIKCQ